MSDRYYNDRATSRDGYTTTDYYSRSSAPRSGDYESYMREHDHRSPSKQVARYEDNHRHSQSRRRSLSPSHLRQDRDLDRDFYYRDDEREYEREDYRDYDDHHHHHHHHHDTSRGPSEHHEHGVHGGKDIAATLIGAAVGGEAGRKFGHHSGLATAAGALVGAWGGHELEKGWQHHEEKKDSRRRYSESR